jgi:NAD(P)-dependent dehydrogenase (short-subunit alcohol dehydrogenase family)
MSWLQGQAALVTGASSGLGAALIEALAREGAIVTGCARRADQGESIAAGLRAQGLAVHFAQADIATAEGRSAAFDAARAHTGRLDILINNAAVPGPVAPIEDIDAETWRRVLDANLTGAVGLCQLALPLMKARKHGIILNIASINAVFGVTFMAAYNASKAALAHFTRTLAAEGAPDNVRANTIILGGVRSEMSRQTAAAMYARATGRTPEPARLDAYEKLMAAPADAAAAIALLCHPQARLITGSDIAIDAALTAGRAASGFIFGGVAAVLNA